MMRKALHGACVGRGVFVSPWMGESGELILVAVTRENRRIAERVLSPGDDHLRAADELWALVEEVDPLPQLKVI